ncbi:FAD-dependent oxidoreductase [Actinopolymorpha pittospori]|uniref:Thioredoxin reductase n=1 Tax=Actinopolymorpha pittospori TaxID=648752 RepID=A0A927MQL5_9ACTN|nr:FAD-dependent oxidoreductase [Actinopolymorpha pittospori]MBE1603428.1 thioredoxin reductase [Actinopolymorpha pittospori]
MTVEVHHGQVDATKGTPGGFTVELADRTRVEAGRLILTTEQVDEVTGVSGLTERFGSSVFRRRFCHECEARGKTLAVVGQTPPQATQALYVADRLTRHGIAIRHALLVKVERELDALVLYFEDGAQLARQAIFHRPTRQQASLATDLGCELLPDGCVRVDQFQRTTVRGVFAAGDMAQLAALPDALTFVVMGAADGVCAVGSLAGPGAVRATQG